MKDFRLKLFTGALIVLLSLSMIMVPSASHALLDDNYRTGDDPGTGTGEPASSGDLFRGTETGTDSTSYGLLTGGKDGLSTGNSLEFSYPKKAMLSGVPRYFQKHMTCSDRSDWDQRNPCLCTGEFPTGCGPVAGATILAWWDRRGFENLMNGYSTDEKGCPRNRLSNSEAGTI